MNWQKIEHTLYLTVKAGANPDAVRRERILRGHVLRHIGKLAKRRKRNAPHVPHHVCTTAQWRIMQHSLKAGHKIVAFDAEWQRCYPYDITELGVAIYHKGKREVHNIRVRAGGGKVDPMTRFMTKDQAIKWLKEIFKDANLLVGHALKNDRAKMSEWGWCLPNISTVDTERWSVLLNPEQKSSINLTKFCTLIGSEVRKGHIAGNDALMTLDVALMLASQKLEESVAA